MNNREQKRYNDYILQYPILGSNQEYKDKLVELCKDPAIGYPALKDNQRQYRKARKERDEKVRALYDSVVNLPSEG